MKKMIFLLLAVLGTLAVFSQNRIRFEDESVSFQKLLKKAKSENKMIFIDCYTSWCGPCKWMATNVFPNDTIGNFFNSHFICASIDMEKGEGPDLAFSLEIGCFPTYIFLDENNRVLSRKSGAYSVKEFLQIGRDAILSDNRYFSLKEKYEAGTISRQELILYINLRVNSCLDTEKEKKRFVEIRPKKDDGLDFVFWSKNGLKIRSFLLNIASGATIGATKTT